jgi:TRAP-type C4-dicarboxylate transport system substrate-binding protein
MSKTITKFGQRLAVAMAALALPGAALADNFTLRIGAGHPSGPSVYVGLVENFFVPEVKRRVAEETEHTVEFIEGYGGAIVGVADTLEAVESGLLDIGAYCMCFEPSKLFLHNFPYYVPFGPEDAVTAMKATRATYDAVPWLTEEFQKYKQTLLGLSGWDNYHLGTTEPWETVDDLKNVKIGGAGPNLPWLEYVGAVPVQSTLPDGYMSLQTGVYNGWLMFPSAYLGFKFFEPAPNYTLIGFGAMIVNALTINNRTLERLPEDVANIIREVGAEYEVKSGTELDARQAAGLKGLRENGTNVKELDDSVRADWAKALAPFASKQAKDADGRGLPGTEVMKTFIEQVSATGYEWLTPYTID